MQLSIIIPVYNCAEYIPSGFENLQPFYDILGEDNFEIIYVNDGSTDNSGSEIDALSRQKTNIRAMHQENQGSSGARNTGIDIAKGTYIQFLDADDLLEAKKVISFLEFALQNKIEVLGYRMDTINEKNELIQEIPPHPLKYGVITTGPQVLIDGYSPSSICSFLFSTYFLNRHNLRITPKITHMDVEFTVRMFIKAERVIFKDVIAYHYLQRSGSITKPKTKEKLKQFIYDEVIVSNLMKKNLTPDMPENLKTAVIKNYNSVVWNLLWRFYVRNEHLEKDFVLKCLNDLRKENLYPIKGPLKTQSQSLRRIIMNNQKLYMKLISKNLS